MSHRTGPTSQNQMTIGSALGHRASRIPVRETVLRMIVVTPQVEDAAQRATDVLLAWLNRKIQPLGVGLMGIGTISKRDGNLAVHATLEHDRMRFKLDEESRDRERAGFVWSVAAQMQAFDGIARIDARLEVEHPYGQPTGALGVPKFLRELIDSIGLEDVHPLRSNAWRVQGNEDVDALVALIGDPRRSLDVVVLTDPLIVDSDIVASRLAGVAHVVILEGEPSWRLSALKTKQHGVYSGAVKTYRPGHDWLGDPRQAPMWLPETIRFVQREEGSHAFLDTLVRQIFASATARFERLALEIEPSTHTSPAIADGEPQVAEVTLAPLLESVPEAVAGEQTTAESDATIALAIELQGLRAQLADQRNELSESKAWLTEVEATNRQLELEVKALRGEGGEFSHLPPDLGEIARMLTAIPKTVLDLLDRVASISDELAAAEVERDEAKRRLYALQAKADSIEAIENAQLIVPVIPWGDGDAFAVLVDERYEGRLLVSPRAQRSFAKGDYAKADTLISYLDFIADEYRSYLMGEKGAHELVRERAGALHVKYGPSVSATGSGLVDGHSMLWEDARYAFEHIRTNGKTFDPKRMLAIYFFLEAAENKIVIAHLPSHLDNVSNNT